MGHWEGGKEQRGWMERCFALLEGVTNVWSFLRVWWDNASHAIADWARMDCVL